MKKVFLVLLCAVLSTSVGVSSVYAGGQNKSKKKLFAKINDQIVEVKGAITSLQDQLDSLVARVDSVEERVVANEQAVVSLNEQNEALQTLVNSNLTSITDIEAEVALLQNDNANLINQIAALAEGDPAVAALQADVAANASLIANLEGSQLMVQDGIITLETSLQDQIDNNLELINTLQDEITTLNENIALKQNLINGVCPDEMAVQQINADGSLVCGEAGGGMSGQLESVYVYSIVSVENGTTPTAPGGKMTVRTDCPAGYTIASSGFNAASGWDLNAFYTVSNPTQQYSIAQGFNNNSYSTKLVGVATCMRVAP
jgi:peptidoglycan hydrolase CwlO-like protein